MADFKINIVADLESLKDKVSAARAAEKIRISLCMGNGCLAAGAGEVYDALKESLEKHGVATKSDLFDEGVKDNINYTHTGCQGMCQHGPLLQIDPENNSDKGITYMKVTVDDVDEIVEKTIMNGEVIERLLHKDANGVSYKNYKDIPFYQLQTFVTMKDCGRINPHDIREYIGIGGYLGLANALKSTPADVIKTMTDSGLKGRGGGGFPTGVKWNFCAKETAPKKYVVCNGDEGDPGAFMDDAIMDGSPQSILEGMRIAGFAIGADEGWIYVRAEYPHAVKSLGKAIEEAREYGLLGDNILGSGMKFDIHIKEGAGAFVCGEETALLASIEGKRGMPRPKPPFPAHSGLFGKPTIINNVETFANVPKIMLLGADVFKQNGVEGSYGTKTFSITGDIVNSGLIEVPMGTKMSDIVYKIGGGVLNNAKLKAVQVGGPSGGCVPADKADVSMDYDSVKAVGAIVGSGGLVVMSETACMVDVAKYFMTFTQSESCGKCTMCREGTKRMLEILTKICDGRGEDGDIETLEELAKAVSDGSLCALGKTAPNPVLSTLRYFRSEYEAHIYDKKCPAGKCTAFKKYHIIPDKCKGCSACARKCPVGAISGELKKPFVIDSEKCIKCGVCAATCKFGAIEF
ncbi:MAG: 4Fe-4S binding protein [Abditibacteriota bacterium]|nr:4Fe-4S binding protein [Abditibacteriota bacterium]